MSDELRKAAERIVSHARLNLHGNVKNLISETEILELASAYLAEHKADESPQQTFDQWWDKIGFSLDPDTSDVPWFDKRKEFAQYAWNAAKTGRHWKDPQ